VHGVLERFRYEELSFAVLLDHSDERQSSRIAPITFAEIDVGDRKPMRCLENALVLCRHRTADGRDLPFALFVMRYRMPGDGNYIRVEIAVPDNAAGRALGDDCMNAFDAAIAEASTYRGKIISMERDDDFRGRSASVRVHRVSKVRKRDLVLPDKTVRLLKRNVVDFMKARRQLRAFGLSTKKGILLYGPPGTGKTHTIRWLARALEGHTTLIITGGQVGLLADYMALARLLQPSMVVIEDVDLIARHREDMNGGCEETMLNRLLNEMDGLQENADILFVLTTNRPQDLEVAISQRPGRIDQAIEIPLPDLACREKLVRLYGRGLRLAPALVAEAARRTDGVSAAFIKELMRRTAQAAILRAGEARSAAEPTEADLSEALDDMLFSGGQLNVKLLGGAADE
jgi:SpoVK/Ycf46/Vps4 family AAA+-type ATPase